VDVGVREAGEHHAAAEVDHLGRGERRLVHADATGDEVARDRQRALRRHLGIESPDQSALKDHGRKSRVAGQRSTGEDFST
jgi:hypothetical protein